MKKVLDFEAIMAQAMAEQKASSVKNAIASRKSRANTKAKEIKAQMLAEAGDDKALIAKAKAYTYAHHIEKTRGCTVEQYESADYKGSKTNQRYGGKSSDRKSPEGKEANRQATNRTNFKKSSSVLELTAAIEKRVFSDFDTELALFVKKYTKAKDDMEFFSTEYKKANKGCHTIKGYAHLARFTKVK